jgi:uncharacterized protein
MIGRTEQLTQLEKLNTSEKSEFLAVLGRRRIGKTFLIDNAFEKQICFQMTGIQLGNTKSQLENFNRKLYFHSKASYLGAPPLNWGEAFFQLRTYLTTLQVQKKQVIFFDELPWINTVKSSFLQELAHLWNDYLSKQKHFILVICGSASSWIASHITNDKGGLHNRLTATINLLPFTLLETKQFLEAKKIIKPIQEIAKIYMTFGGIPYYLDDIQRGESTNRTIERMCFEPNGKLKNEYDNLYKALFQNALNHEKIVEALAGSQKGMQRSQIIEKTKLQDGGPFTRAMNDLIACGFVSTINQFKQKKRGENYRLNDEFTVFYHRFMKQVNKYEAGGWVQKANSQAYKIWLGYAFELLAFRHINQIKTKLGINGIYSEISTFYHNIGKDNGMQADMLIERKDNAINFCEIKHYESQFKFDKNYYNTCIKKLSQFRDIASSKVQILFTLICSQPIKENNFSADLVDNVITIEDFFS